MRTNNARTARLCGSRCRGSLLVEFGLALLLLPVFVFFGLRHLSGVEPVQVLGDAEVGVRLDRWSGDMTVLEGPGAHPFLPFLQEVAVLDRRPAEYVMQGDERSDGSHVPQLVLRARDGATFGFSQVVVQYVIDVPAAPRILSDSGPSASYKAKLVDLFAGPVLRAEFGRYTTGEVLDAANRQAATEAAKTALDGHLNRHGIKLLEIAVSKPEFAPEYETVFKRRLVANQDTAALRRDMTELEAGHEEHMAQVGRIKDSERKIILEAGQVALEKARLELLRGRAEADRQFAMRVKIAEMERAEKLARAERLDEQKREEAEALRLEIEDLAARGQSAVRAALVDRLEWIQFELEPRDLWPAQLTEAAQTVARTGGSAR